MRCVKLRGLLRQPITQKGIRDRRAAGTVCAYCVNLLEQMRKYSEASYCMAAQGAILRYRGGGMAPDARGMARLKEDTDGGFVSVRANTSSLQMEERPTATLTG